MASKTKRDWDAILDDMERSGLNPNQYARRNRLSKSLLYRHQKEREAKRQLTLRGDEVHELTITNTTHYPVGEPPALTLSYGGAQLTFTQDVSAKWLGALLKELEGGC